MKHKLLFILLLLFVASTVSAKSETVLYQDSIIYDISNIKNIISLNEYTIINTSNTDTTIYSYNNKEQIASKKIENLTNSTIIKYQDNILLAGIKGNTLTIYLLDNTLRILSSKETSYIVNSNSNINLYSYEDKIYITITKNNILSNNNIYELDTELNINEKSFSSITNIKDILKSDYYTIKYSDIENGIIKSSTTLKENYILVGSKDETSVIYIYNNQELISTFQNEKYSDFIKVLIIQDNIVVLAKDIENKSILLFLNNDGTINEEEILENDITDMYQVGDRLILTSIEEDKTTFHTYTYKLNIINESLPYGTVEIPKEAKYNEEVTINVKANSGYELDTITIKDAHGNTITLKNNSFQMPDTNVYIVVNYKETLENPNTVDIITIFVCLLVISSIAIRYFYKKAAWLK